MKVKVDTAAIKIWSFAGHLIKKKKSRKIINLKTMFLNIKKGNQNQNANRK